MRLASRSHYKTRPGQGAFVRRTSAGFPDVSNHVTISEHDTSRVSLRLKQWIRQLHEKASGTVNQVHVLTAVSKAL